VRAFHVSRTARERYDLNDELFGLHGSVLVADLRSIRRLAARMNDARARGEAPGPPTISAGELSALGILHEVFHHLIGRYDAATRPGAIADALAALVDDLGAEPVDRVIDQFDEDFPAGAVTRRHDPSVSPPPLAPAPDAEAAEALEELLLLRLTNANPAAEPLRELFDDRPLAATTDYPILVARLETMLDAGPPVEPGGVPLLQLLRAPMRASPTSLAAQLRFVRDNWGPLLGDLGNLGGLLDRLLVSLDVIAEEERALHQRFGGGGPGLVERPSFEGLDVEPERFSWDSDWMPRVVLISKSTYVWLDQLSRAYEREIRTLDAIPDEELDRLAAWGVTGLWLIGLWERSKASRRIKELRGNPDAVASAYALDDYRIADDLGGEGAYEDLRYRAWERGIRLASDMVPNHMGIDAGWVVEHPDWFISLAEPPYPAYSFNGPDLSTDARVGIFLEDHYYDSSDAAVVFRRLDRSTGENRYVYHGNDGTSFPWNDTAQLDYLRADVREAVIQTILAVARRFPIIRFDAAMVLAKKHVQRLWYPEPGSGGGIPSRAEHGLPKAEFDKAMPHEFWREVVDRVTAEVPDTLLLAEAFWLLEGYFVRTLGMHRVYNSAFMHMLRDEDNAGYRRVMKETLEFDPAILQRYVNFMTNPDELTAVEQFGKGDKYFGVATLLATLPGLPMIGHGQVEGFSEKYGMEYRRAYRDEQPDAGLVEHHERVVFPVLHRRSWFAGADEFLLYDFVRADGSVDEDVFAYSNGRGPTRSLVVYHNRFASTAGRIRHSVAFARKDGGERSLVRRTLADGLGLTARGDDTFLAFRDAGSRLEYLRSARDLRESGLWVELDAYRSHVFWEFREIPDPAGLWRRLADHLGGRGVPSLEEALRELELEPVHAAVRRVAGDPAIVALVRDGATLRSGTVEAPVRELVDAVASATGTDGRRHGVIVITALERLATIAASAAPGERLGAPAEPDGGIEPAARGRAAELPFADPFRRAVLVGWAVLEPLGGLAPGATTGPTSRAWFDELRLAPVVAAVLREAGLDEGEAWRAAERLRALLAVPRPATVGGRTPRERVRRLVEAWLDHPDVRPLIRVNLWEGTEWFGREEWRELIEWTRLLDVVDRARDSGRKRSVDAVDTDLTGTLMELGQRAGYRVDRLRELVGAGAPPSRPPAASDAMAPGSGDGST